MRTHILVSLGATLFVLGSIGAGLGSDATSRIVQGIITGIGFIGGGTILKHRGDIKGLTTSAGWWATCAIGVVIGLGELGIALLAGALVLVVLATLHQFEIRIARRRKRPEAHTEVSTQ